MHKRKLIFLLMILLVMTGCAKITDDLDEVVDAVDIGHKIDVNTASTGYELYIPIGVKQITDNEYNQRFKIRNRYIYLYVDTTSYFYKNTLNYKTDSDYNYYFKELKFGDKVGYIGINKVEDNLCYTEIVYNYSKIEFYSDPNELNSILANSLVIIKSIKYNDALISSQVDNENSDGREFKYQLDSPKDAESTFSETLQEYVPEEIPNVELPDDNQAKEVQNENIG